MPWVVFDPVENDYLCEEQRGEGGELWDPDIEKATQYETAEKARAVFEEIDVEKCLPHIHPLYVEQRGSPRKRWEDMTFAEKMAKVDDDFHTAVADRVERRLVNADPLDTKERYARLIRAGFVVTNQVHDEYHVERKDKKPMTEADWHTVTSIMSTAHISMSPMHNFKPAKRF